MDGRRLVDDADLVRRVRDLRDSGATYARITSELGIGTSTVSRILGTNGVRRRPRIPPDVRERARQLRVDGMSVPDIAAHLGLARSTAWLLTRDVPRRDANVGAGNGRRVGVSRRARAIERHREKFGWGRSVDHLSDRELMLIGAAIYWAEGAKDKPWRRSECLTFVNSDPSMITVFLRWLELMGVAQSRLTFRLQIHESADVDAALQYWSEVVGVPSSSFKPTTLKRHNPRARRRNVFKAYHGCLSVRVSRSAAEYRAAEGLWIGATVAAARRG